MATLEERALALSDRYVGLTARRDTLGELLDTNRAKMAVLADKKAHLTKTVAVLDTLTQTIAKKGIGRVESVVTQGLQLVFGPDASCIVEKKDGARGTTYQINVKFGEIVGDPMDDFGGGAVNVTAFLLRVMMLHRFNLARMLVLDESFNNVSTDGGYLQRVSILLKSLVEDFNFTILAVSHQPELAARADHTYQVGGSIGSPTIKLLTVGDEA
jgi:DNA repair ATPase RecN